MKRCRQQPPDLKRMVQDATHSAPFLPLRYLLGGRALKGVERGSLGLYAKPTAR